MSFSQMDPSLVTPSPLSRQSIDTPSNTLTTGPDVARLTLASNFGDSPQSLTKGAGGTKKRYRRTQKEMAAYRAKQAQLKKAKALAKAKVKRSKARGGGSQSSRATRASTKTSMGEANNQDAGVPGASPLGSQPTVPDSNPPFNADNYENVCGYLEEEANYTRLYGDGSKTVVGVTKMTKAAAYEIFAIFINDNSNRRLRLTGSQLRQRIDGYKKRFMKAKHWAENTGAGIKEGEDLPTLAEILEKKCPCYERMYGIFAGKANVTPLAQYDSGVGGDLYPSDHQDIETLQEVFFSGWESTQVSQPHLGITTPATQNLDRVASALDQLAGLSLPILEGDDDDDEDDLPPPLNLSGTDMDALPSVSALRSRARATNGSGVPPSGTLAARTGVLPGSQASSPEVPLASPLDATGRRAFANLRSGEASPAGPPKESNARAKTTLASAFESSNSEKFGYLKEHMSWEKEKETKRLEWEKERYQKELDKAKDGANGQLKMAEMKMNAAREWMTQGKSTAEVEGLLKAVYG
ncbi:hypothetical protein PGT21_050142 [Puccinia graminis f. sp. tritici]|uniref:Uncharacterized protein n=1 Tax=Puccinia graminis f. sp. tritici TaxID=56615 RepID=A0A5B0NJE4_PUCGR|nr:hypothetical protein PGTUg99_007413 [Puccinia graminis f. sp. tritici]KAA1105276.1 hypothetical protein PGT21_050142 [Puccinia graminis f. sp. tritici]